MYINCKIIISCDICNCIKKLFLLAFLYSTITCKPEIQNTFEFNPELIHTSRERNVTIFYDNDRPKGSGFLINNDGYILTAFHVVGLEPIIRISKDKRNFINAKLVYYEKKFDLALLKIENHETKLPRISWTGVLDLNVNDTIYMIAAPLGLMDSFMKGYISNLKRLDYDILYPEIPYIQTYGTSFEGCSGAAVYTAIGNIFGLNRATFGTSYGNSFGLVIPTEFIHVFFEEAKKKGLEFDY